MKLRYIVGALVVVVIISVGMGVYCKSTYRDFDQEENVLDDFAVALIDDEFLEWQLQVMDEKLSESNIIVAAKCEETFTYRYSCVTQKVCVINVFKGEGINEGDKIEIARAATLLSIDEDSKFNDKYLINMGFVNEMVPGKTYLIFMDRKINTYDKDINIYIQSDKYMLAPIFCYEEITNIPRDTSDEYSTYIDYRDVKENEFFIMSKESVEKISSMKEKLLKEYDYE